MYDGEKPIKQLVISKANNYIFVFLQKENES